GCGAANLSSTASGANRSTEKVLTVFAAASLTASFGEVARKFEAENPGVRIVCNFAGSQQLLAQLQHGARADVFASASPAEMAAALNERFVEAGKDRIFARN